MTPADFATGDVLRAPERACAAAFVELARLPPERVEAIRRAVDAPPLGAVGMALAGSPGVAISVCGYARPFGFGRNGFSRVEPSAFVVVYAPERARCHVARRVLREVVLPALAAHPSPVARTSAAILAERSEAGAVLFATAVDPEPTPDGPALRFDVSLYSVRVAEAPR